MTSHARVMFQPRARTRLEIRPCELKEANAFVAKLHRHHPPVAGHRFSVAAWLLNECTENTIVGVAICGRPVGRKTDLRGDVLEVTRLCTDGTFNACSMLYAACARVAEAMGYRRIQTFLLARETGTSLRAAGWREDGPTPGKAWVRTMGDLSGAQLLLDGQHRHNDHPLGPKVRWVRDFRPE